MSRLTECSLALFCGGLFGMGLALSGMTDPANIIGFLDVTGAWNPQLVFVLAAAVGTSVAGFFWLGKRSRPVFALRFRWPEASGIDIRLLSGAVLFGVGWGLYGYCPGPALAALVYGQSQTVIFVVSMLAGMAICQLFTGQKSAAGVSSEQCTADRR
ncbi:YeeE/YedE family protein [Aliamphritea hakodatensis]|uniref:YeeE/YedE family protein n=1 Tax=Aliamphritea hakodatensis TaxID=2895352 RepID=UPI0022FD8599|nr:YeeE/YedE family protein [Aliamphritea hakodatensis]